jgi:hypothetical protein
VNVKYVVSIAGELLYFDEQRAPAPNFPESAPSEAEKPALKLLPPAEKTAAKPEWNEALKEFSAEQRDVAEISEVQANSR